MTIQEAIDRIDILKPNKYPAWQKISWLSGLDTLVWKEIYSNHEPGDAPLNFEGYDQDTLPDTELLVPEPYSDIYQHYMATQMDIANAELNKYAADMQLFTNAWTMFDDYWTRKYMPNQRVTQFGL